MTAADKNETVRPAPKAVAAASAFVRDHGEPALAVVENLGQAGARVVLIGADGSLGDVMVPGVETGNALVEAVDGLTGAEWDGETSGALKIGAAHRRKMAGPKAR